MRLVWAERVEPRRIDRGLCVCLCRRVFLSLGGDCIAEDSLYYEEWDDYLQYALEEERVLVSRPNACTQLAGRFCKLSYLTPAHTPR